MNDQLKENDLMVSTILNPEATTQDLVLNGLLASNTMLLTLAAYKDMPFILKTYTNQNGIFDNERFNKDYQKAQLQYISITDLGVIDNFDKFISYDKGDIYAPIGAPTLDNTVKVQKQANPYHTNEGLKSLYGIGESNLSIRELAQLSLIWDTDKLKWMDKTANELGLLGGLVTPSLVYATWDEDGYHIDPITGMQTKHHKGEYKLNDDGEFYTETLGNRESYGKEFVSLSDVLTKEGSAWNKIDFFDSDDKKKSITGTVAKVIFTSLPYFIPYVGTYLGAASAAFELSEAMPELIKAGASIVSGPDYKPSEWLNRWENFYGKFHESSSDYAKEHMWSVENIGGFVTHSVKMLKQMEGMGTVVQALSKPKDLELLGNKILSDYLASESAGRALTTEIMTAAEAGADDLLAAAVSGKNIQAGITTAVNNSPQALAYARKVLKLSEWVGLGFVGIAQGKDLYQEALQSGYDRRTAGVLAYTGVAALLAVIGAQGKIATWMFPKLTMANVPTSKDLIEATKSTWKELSAKINKIQSTTDKNVKTRKFAEMLTTCWNKIKNIRTKDYAGNEGYWTNVLRTGIENTILMQVNDAIRAMADGLNSLGILGEENKNRATFGAGEKWRSGQMVQEWLLTFVGSAIGGVIFLSGRTLDNKVMALFLEQSPEVKHTIISLVRDGYADNLKEIAKDWAKNDNVTIQTESTQGVTTPMNGGLTRGQATSNAFCEMIDYLQANLEKVDLNRPSEEVVSKIVNREIVIDQLNKTGLTNLVVKDVDRAVERYIKAKSEYDTTHLTNLNESLNTSNNKTEQDPVVKTRVEKEFEEAKKELFDILQGKKTEDYLITSLLYKDPDYRNIIQGTTFNNYITANYGNLTLELIKELFGLTELNLKENWEKWKEKKDNPEFFLKIARLFEKLRKEITPTLKEQSESKYTDIRSEVYENWLKRDIMNMLPSIMDANYTEGNSEAIFNYANDTHTQSRGVNNISFSYLFEHKPELIDKLVEEAISVPLDTVLKVYQNVNKQELIDKIKSDIKGALGNIPINNYSSDSFKKLLIDRINLNLSDKTLNIEYTPKTETTRGTAAIDIYQQLYNILDNGTESFTERAVEALEIISKILDETYILTQDDTSKLALQFVSPAFKASLTLVPLKDIRSFVNALGGINILLIDGDITEADIRNKLSGLMKTIEAILKNLEFLLKEISIEEGAKIIANRLEQQLKQMSPNVVDIRMTALNDYIEQSSELDGEIVYSARNNIKKSFLNLIPTLRDILLKGSVSPTDRESILTTYQTAVSNNENAFESIARLSEYSELSDSVKKLIKDLQEQYKALSDLKLKIESKTIKKNNLLEALRDLDARLGTTHDFSKLLNVYDSIITDVETIPNLVDFELTADKLQALEDINHYIDLLEIISDMSVKKDTYDYTEKDSYNYVLSQFKGESIPNTLNDRDNNIIKNDLNFLRSNLKAVINLTNRQLDIKDKTSAKQSLAYAKALNNLLLSTNITINGVSVIPTGIERDDGHSEELLIKTSANIYKLMSELKASNVNLYNSEFKRIVSDLVPLDIDKLIISQLKVSNISETMAANKLDLLTFFLSSVAEDSNAFYTRFKSYLSNLPIVPFATQEISARMISAYVQNSEVFELALKIISDTAKVDDTKPFTLNNFIKLTGVTGAGKTKVVTALALQREEKLKVTALAPSTVLATNLADSIKSTTNIVKSTSYNDLFKAALSSDKYEDLQNDLKADNTTNLKVSKYNDSIKIGVIGTFKTSDINIELVRVFLGDTLVITIDEATNLSSIEMLLLDTIVKAIFKNDHKRIPVVLIGDNYLNGSIVLNNQASHDGAFTWNTPMLMVSVRANNKSSRLNISTLQGYLELVTAKANENNNVNKNGIAAASVFLIHYSDSKLLEGAKFLIDNNDLRSEYQKIYDNLKEYNRQHNSNNKLLIIAHKNSSGRISDDLASLLSGLGITESEYEIRSPEAYDSNYMLGSEAPFVIVHEFSEKFKDKGKYDQIREIYTIITRASEGSVVNYKSANSGHTISVVHDPLSNREETVISPNRLKEKRDKRLEKVNKFLEGSTIATTAPNFGTTATPVTPTTNTPTITPVAPVGAPTVRTVSSTTTTTATTPTGPTVSTPYQSVDDIDSSEIDTSMPSVSINFSAKKAPYLIGDQSNANKKVEEIYIYPGLNTNGVKQGLGYGAHKGQGDKHYDIAISNKRKARFLDLNGLGKPESEFARSASQGIKFLLKIIPYCTSTEQIITIISGDLEHKRNVSAFFRYLLPDLYGTTTLMNEKVDAYWILTESILRDCLTDDPKVHIMAFPWQSEYDNNSNSTKFGPATGTIVYRLVLRLQSDKYGVDHCISIGHLPSSNTLSNNPKFNELKQKLDNIYREVNDQLSNENPYALFETDLSLFKNAESNNANKVSLFAMKDPRAIIRTVQGQSTIMSLDRLLMEGMRVDPDKRFTPVLLSKEEVTYIPDKENVSKFKTLFGDQIKLPSGLITWAETITILLQENTGFGIDKNTLHKLIDETILTLLNVNDSSTRAKVNTELSKVSKNINNKVLMVINTTGITDYSNRYTSKFRTARVPVLLAPNAKSMQLAVINIIKSHNTSKNDNSFYSSGITRTMRLMDSTSLANTLITILKKLEGSKKDEPLYVKKDNPLILKTHPENGKNVPDVISLLRLLENKLSKINDSNNTVNSNKLHDLVIIEDLNKELAAGKITTMTEIYEFLTGKSRPDGSKVKINGIAVYTFIKEFIQLSRKEGEGDKFYLSGLDESTAVKLFNEDDRVFARLNPLDKTNAASFKKGASDLILINDGTSKTTSKALLLLLPNSGASDFGLGLQLRLINTYLNPPQLTLNPSVFADSTKNILNVTDSYHKDAFGKEYNPSEEYTKYFTSEAKEKPLPLNPDYDAVEYYKNHDKHTTQFIIDSTYNESNGIKIIKKDANNYNIIQGDNVISIDPNETFKGIHDSVKVNKIFYTSRADGKTEIKSYGFKLGDIVQLYNDTSRAYMIINIGGISPDFNGATLTLTEINTDVIKRTSWAEIWNAIKNDAYKGMKFIIDASDPDITELLYTRAPDLFHAKGDAMRRIVKNVQSDRSESAKRLNFIMTAAESQAIFYKGDLIYIPSMKAAEGDDITAKYIEDTAKLTDSKNKFMWSNISRDLLGDYTTLDYSYLVVPAKKGEAFKYTAKLNEDIVIADKDGNEFKYDNTNIDLIKILPNNRFILKDPAKKELLSTHNYIWYTTKKGEIKEGFVSVGAEVPSRYNPFVWVNDNRNGKIVPVKVHIDKIIDINVFKNTNTLQGQVRINASIVETPDPLNKRGMYKHQLDQAYLVFNEKGLSDTVEELFNTYKKEEDRDQYAFTIIKVNNEHVSRWGTNVNGVHITPTVIIDGKANHGVEVWRQDKKENVDRLSITELDKIYKDLLLNNLTEECKSEKYLKIPWMSNRFEELRNTINNSDYTFTKTLQDRLKEFNIKNEIFNYKNLRNSAILANVELSSKEDFKNKHVDTSTKEEKQKIADNFKTEKGKIGTYTNIYNIPMYIVGKDRSKYDIVREGNHYTVYVNYSFFGINKLNYHKLTKDEVKLNIGKLIVRFNKSDLELGRKKIEWVGTITGVKGEMSKSGGLRLIYDIEDITFAPDSNYSSISSVDINQPYYSHSQFGLFTTDEYNQFLDEYAYNKGIEGQEVDVDDIPLAGTNTTIINPTLNSGTNNAEINYTKPENIEWFTAYDDLYDELKPAFGMIAEKINEGLLRDELMAWADRTKLDEKIDNSIKELLTLENIDLVLDQKNPQTCDF